MRWLAWLSMMLFVGVAMATPYFSRDLVFRWTASSGPVHQYECVLADGTILFSMPGVPEIRFRPTARTLVSVRCRGLDVDGVRGPWSETSATYRVYGLPADATGDGVIASPDFLLLSENYGTMGWDLVVQTP